MDFAGHTILVVEDEEMLRKTLAFYFKRKGFTVLEAAGGHEAFAMVQARKIDVVLSDVRMPDGDGIELLDKIRHHYPAGPAVIFITGYANLTLEDAFHKGAHGVFSKPFDKLELIQSVSRAIQRQTGGEFLNEELETINFAAKVQTSHIGRSGIFVPLSTDFPPIESKVKFEISFRTGPLKNLSGTGIVRWIRETSNGNFRSGCGIEFLSLAPNCKEQVLQLMERTKPKATIPKA